MNSKSNEKLIRYIGCCGAYCKTCKGGCLTVSSSVEKDIHCDPYCLNLIEKEIMAPVNNNLS